MKCPYFCQPKYPIILFSDYAVQRPDVTPALLKCLRVGFRRHSTELEFGERLGWVNR